MKKSLCLLLVASMLLSLAACGKKAENQKNPESSEGGKSEYATTEASHYFEPTYYENLPEELSNSSSQKFRGNSIFFIGNNTNYTKSGLYEYSLDTKTMKTYVEVEKDEYGDPTVERGDITFYGINDNRYIYLYHTYQVDPSLNDIDFDSTTEDDVTDYFMNNWGYDAQMAQDELKGEYYQGFKFEDGSLNYGAILKHMLSSDYPTIHKYYLVGSTLDGNELFRNDVAFVGDDPENNSYGYVMDLALDSDDNMYVLYNKYGDEYDDYYVAVFDKDGKSVAEYKQQSYIEKLYNLENGKVAFMTYNDAGGNDLIEIDPATAKANDKPVFTSKFSSYGTVPYKDGSILAMDSAGLKLYTNGQNESELFMKWMDSNIMSGNVSSLGVLGDGKLALYLNHFVNDRYVAEIVTLNEVDKEKLLNKTQIRVATLYLNSDLEEAVIDFNKKNNDYHVDVIQFNYEGDDYDNYMDYVNSFMLSLATDNTIDVIAINDANAYNHFMNFAQKGLMIDLDPLIEQDKSMDKANFIQNLINPLYYDKKLIALPASLSIQTVIGKAADVGTKMGWEPKEAMEILSSKGEDAIFMLYIDRQDMLEKCMNLAYNEFVDIEKGTCDFDNDTFVQALEFSNIFPEEINWEDENYEANVPERVSKGKILTGSMTVSDFDMVQQYETVWNDDATYIGYPSAGKNNGSLIYYEGLYGITKNCESPETAWQLISKMMEIPSDKNEYRDKFGPYNMYIYPTKDNLDIAFDLVNENYGDEGYTNYWDSFEIQMKKMPEEERQKYKDVVYGTTAVYGSVPKGVMDIIKEEASSYYSGQKTAKEVAAIVQSRVKIYLSETR